MNNSARQSVWNPWHELNNTFEDTLSALFGMVPEFTPQHDYPPINIWSGENEIKMSVKLPGVKPEDIEINIKHDTLNLKCSRMAESIPEGTIMRRSERINGNWQRNFSLPFAVDQDAVTAGYKNGILTITLPKAQAEKARKISVSAAAPQA